MVVKVIGWATFYRGDAPAYIPSPLQGFYVLYLRYKIYKRN